MHGFSDLLRDGLKRCHVGNERLLVAVSGGADSVALLRGLVQLSTEFSLELYVAHLNHGLRGIDSDADAAWVNDLAASLQLPSEIGVVGPGALSASASGLEENARNLRYQFFDETAVKLGCSTTALAHTAEDQAETVLHHLLRGTGVSGLCGIPRVRATPSHRRIVRPILDVRRALLEQYLQDCGQPFRSDATNDDIAMTRNKLRHVVLPLLREQLNPQVDTAICRLAEQAMELEEFLSQLAGTLLDRSMRDAQQEACRLDTSELLEQPRPVVRELFRDLWKRQQWPRQAMGFEHWNRLVDMLKTRHTITLPDRIEVRFHSEHLLVLRRL